MRTTLTSTFSESAERAAPTKSPMAASFHLIGADTRRGMDAETTEAFNVVKGQSAGVPSRAGYLARYEASAGAGVAAESRPTARFTM